MFHPVPVVTSATSRWRVELHLAAAPGRRAWPPRLAAAPSVFSATLCGRSSCSSLDQSRNTPSYRPSPFLLLLKATMSFLTTSLRNNPDAMQFTRLR